jgi:hypothetical protein
MSDTQNITRVDRYSVAEDLALEAILAMERAWGRAHRDGELEPDEWGEGPSRVRLADLGLDARAFATTSCSGRAHGTASSLFNGRDSSMRRRRTSRAAASRTLESAAR